MFSGKELRESRSAAAGSPGSMMKLVEDYKATEFISIFQKFKLAFNLLVKKNNILKYSNNILRPLGPL